MTATEELQPDIVAELRQSYKVRGPLRKCIITPFGLAAGHLRKLAVPEWPELVLEKDRCPDYYTHLQYAVADNLADRNRDAWWTKVLGEAARELEKQGVQPGDIANRIVKDFGLSTSRVYRYLPNEFKMKEKQVSPGRPQSPVFTPKTEPVAGPTESAAGPGVAAPEKVEEQPKEQRQVPVRPGGPVEVHPREPISQGQYNKKVDTPAEMHLRECYDRAHVPYRGSVPFEIVGEKTKDGKPKAYIVDFIVGLDSPKGVEVEGEGSSSKDNPERDKYLKEHYGLDLAHLSNEHVMEYGDEIAAYTAVLLK